MGSFYKEDSRPACGEGCPFSLSRKHKKSARFRLAGRAFAGTGAFFKKTVYF